MHQIALAVDFGIQKIAVFLRADQALHSSFEEQAVRRLDFQRITQKSCFIAVRLEILIQFAGIVKVFVAGLNVVSKKSAVESQVQIQKGPTAALGEIQPLFAEGLGVYLHQRGFERGKLATEIVFQVAGSVAA